MSRTLGHLIRPLAKGVGKVANTYRWLGVPSAAISAHCYSSTLIEPARSYMMQMPLGPEVPSNMTKRLMEAIEARVWVLDMATATHRASHYDAKGQLLWELSEQFRYSCPSQHPDFDFKLRRLFEGWNYYPKRLVSGVVDSGTNIYHWLYDGLPRLALAQRMGIEIESLYVDTSRPFVLQSLEMVGIKPRHVINAARYPNIQAKQMVIPSFPLYAGRQFKPIVPSWALGYLRSRLAISSSKQSERLFVSRKDAHYRPLADEDTLFETLKPRGFKRVVLSGLSLQTQREIFASASVVVAPHGAGLANMLFCQPGTKILELFHPGFVQQCYWQLANMLHLPYFCLRGTFDEKENEKIYPFAPIRVSAQQLHQALDFMAIQ